MSSADDSIIIPGFRGYNETICIYYPASLYASLSPSYSCCHQALPNRKSLLFPGNSGTNEISVGTLLMEKKTSERERTPVLRLFPLTEGTLEGSLTNRYVCFHFNRFISCFVWNVLHWWNMRCISLPKQEITLDNSSASWKSIGASALFVSSIFAYLEQ